MKKKLLIPISIVILAVLAVLFLFPPYKTLKEADTLLSAGSYTEALAVYSSVINDGARTPFFRDRAEAGLAACAEAALEAKDESFIDLSAAEDFLRPEGEAAAARLDAALEGLNTVRAERLEAERLAEEERLRLEAERAAAEEAARIAREEAEAAAAAAARQQELEDQFNEALLSHDHLLALSVSALMETEEARTEFSDKADRAHTLNIPLLRSTWQNRLGAGTWYTALLTDTLLMQGDERYKSETMPIADSICAGDFGVLLIRDGVPFFYGDTLGAVKEIEGMNDIVSGSVGMNHALLLHKDGTVSAVGAKQYEKAEVAAWTDIVDVAAGAFHSVGVDKHGNVFTAGLDADTQCSTSLWRDIVAVEAGMRHTVGLLPNGHVVATGDNSFGQCDVGEWTDIVAIACGPNHTVGLKRDGTVVAAGDNGAGQCEVGGWSHVIAVKAGMWHTVALLEDGRVIACGANEHTQCDTGSLRAFTVTEYDIKPAKDHGESSAYVYVQDWTNGPWVYYGNQGAVVISLEDQYKLVATRADLFCTAGVYPEGILSGGGSQTAGTNTGAVIAKQNHCVFAINGDYFNHNYNPSGIKIRRGKVYANLVSEKKSSLGVAFWPDNSMRVVDTMKITAEEIIALGIRDAWVFGPLLILNGEAQDISYSPLSYNDVTLRSAIGSICPCHHVALSCGRGTLAQVTQLFLDYGCTIAYNLDGGRSVWMTFMGERINRSYFKKNQMRSIPDMIGFLHDDSVR